MNTYSAIRKVTGVRREAPRIRKSGLITQVGGARESESQRGRGIQSSLPKLRINQRLIPEIIAECERFTDIDIETGSVLLGRTAATSGGRQINVDIALPPGEGLDRQRASFSQASQLHDELLAWYQRNDPSVRYLGDWHRHEGMAEASRGDLMTAKAVLDDPDFGVNELLVVIASHHRPSWFRPAAKPWLVNALRGTRVDPDDYSLRFFYLAHGMKQFAELQPVPFMNDHDDQTTLYEQWYAARDRRFERELKLFETIGHKPRIRISGKHPNVSFEFAHRRWKNQIVLTTGPKYPRQRPGGWVIEGDAQYGFAPNCVGLTWSPDNNLAQFLVAALSFGLHGMCF